MSNYPNGFNDAHLDGMAPSLEADQEQVDRAANAVAAMLEAVAKVATRFKYTILPASFEILAEVLTEVISENVDGELERLHEAGYEARVRPISAVCKRASEITFEAVRIRTVQSSAVFESLRPFPVNPQTHRDIAEANAVAAHSVVEGV